MHKYNVRLGRNLIPLHQTNRLDRHVQDTFSAVAWCWNRVFTA